MIRLALHVTPFASCLRSSGLGVAMTDEILNRAPWRDPSWYQRYKLVIRGVAEEKRAAIARLLPLPTKTKH